MTNCPNCGAPITGWRCEYCETVFDISETEKLKRENDLVKAKTQCLHNSTMTENLYKEAIRAMRAYTNPATERNRYIMQELRGPYGIKW